MTPGLSGSSGGIRKRKKKNEINKDRQIVIDIFYCIKLKKEVN